MERNPGLLDPASTRRSYRGKSHSDNDIVKIHGTLRADAISSDFELHSVGRTIRGNRRQARHSPGILAVNVNDYFCFGGIHGPVHADGKVPPFAKAYPSELQRLVRYFPVCGFVLVSKPKTLCLIP